MTRWALLLLAASTAVPAGALAQSDANLIPAARPFTSPERFIIELRGGPYNANGEDNAAYTQFFSDDSGPFLGFQLSYIPYRLPDILYLTVGGGFGWANVSGPAVAAGTSIKVSEETSLAVLPLTALASLRVDAIARLLHIPFILAGKVGWTWAHWDTETGNRDEASGWSLGPMVAGQLAFDLDIFEPTAARSMDEEWGINHSFAFFEIYTFFPIAKSLPVGGLNWVAGLGFNF